MVKLQQLKWTNYLLIMFLLISCNESKIHYASYYAKMNTEDTFPPDLKGVIKFSTKNNAFRKSKEIPILPDKFYLNKWSGNGFVGWGNLHYEIPAHKEKYIYFDTSNFKLLSESDVFVGKLDEILLLRYYISSEDSLYKWYSRITLNNGKVITLTKIQSDSILRNWGLID